MSSTTTKTTDKIWPWWYCGHCGFKNKPHHNHLDVGRCEQCGADRRAELPHADYKPEGQ